MTAESSGWSGDLWGGLASMLVALPSAIAFGVLVFAAIGPEYAAAGAMAGALGTATLGLIAPYVGGNGGFITAPCAPAAAVMSGLAASLAASGEVPAERIIALMVLAALLSAAMQIGYGLARLGRLIKYIPYQVVSGYLSGVALIIALGQVPKLLGFPAELSLLEGVVSPSEWQWPGVLVGLVTIGTTLVAPRVTKKVPAPILGLTAGIGGYFLMGLALPELLVLENNALVIGTIETSGSLADVVTQGFRTLSLVESADLPLVLATAVTLSVLLSIDTLKTGVVLDVLTRRRHNSNREIVAQGVGNAVAALTGGMPGAGTMGPTLVNVTSGGRSPLSGFTEGLLAAVAFLALRSVIAWVPIGALAGILLVIAGKMFDWKFFRLALRGGTRLDFTVIAVVITVAVAVGLIQASAVGVGLAILLFIRDQISGSVILRRRDLREVASKTRRLSGARDLLDEHGDEAVLVELQGNLFFGTTDQLFSELMEDMQARGYVLLDLRRVQSMDYTAGQLFHQMRDQLADHEGHLLLAGMPTGTSSGQDIERYLEELGLLDEDSGIELYETRDDALEWMEEQILESHDWSAPDQAPPLSLGEIELFREFDPETLASLAEIAVPISLEAGEALFSGGDEGDAIYLIRRGSIEILLPLPGDKRHHLATMSRGDYFGEMAFLDKGKRSADAEAKVATELFELSRSRFNDIVHGEALVGTKVFARLALMVTRRLRLTNHELRALEER